MAQVVSLPRRKTPLEIQREMRLQGKRGNVCVVITKERDMLFRTSYVIKVTYWRFNDPNEPPEVVHRVSMRGLVPEIVVGEQERALRDNALFDYRNDTGEPDECFLYLNRRGV